MKKNIIYFCFLFLVVKSNSFAQSYQYFPPADETKRDKALVAFIAKLKKAIQEKNSTSFISLLDKNVNLSFGGEHGINDFKKMWHPEKPTSELWPLLKKIVDLGGDFMRDNGSPATTEEDDYNSYIFPYVFNIEMPNDSIDVFGSYVAIDKKIYVYKIPSFKAEPIATLSYHLVTGEDKGKGWMYVQTIDKKIKGYVQRNYLWSPVDYRMSITKENGNWKITSLVAGD